LARAGEAARQDEDRGRKSVVSIHRVYAGRHAASGWRTTDAFYRIESGDSDDPESSTSCF
jgi:hypothetical protein